ncbi:hypothetical protein MTHERMOG20_22800 [Moorella thermoacetica]|nr:hypothetical protein MTHERMOG20_22800 [Moorella thermoacetica]
MSGAKWGRATRNKKVPSRLPAGDFTIIPGCFSPFLAKVRGHMDRQVSWLALPCLAMPSRELSQWRYIANSTLTVAGPRRIAA